MLIRSWSVKVTYLGFGVKFKIEVILPVLTTTSNLWVNLNSLNDQLPVGLIVWLSAALVLQRSGFKSHSGLNFSGLLLLLLKINSVQKCYDCVNLVFISSLDKTQGLRLVLKFTASGKVFKLGTSARLCQTCHPISARGSFQLSDALQVVSY